MLLLLSAAWAGSLDLLEVGGLWGTPSSANPAALWLLDPVIGDHGRVFVKPGIPEFMRDRAVPAADILTPNAFELGWLTGLPTDSVERAVAASRRLRGDGHAIVVATGVPAPYGAIATLAVHDCGVDVVVTPRIDVAVNGTGDSFAALFLARLLSTRDVAAALGHATSALCAVLRATAAARAKELELIAAQEMLPAPAPLYAAARLG